MLILLKLLLHFFRPLLWIVLLLVYALLSKYEQRRKLALRIAFGMLLFFTNPYIIKKLLNVYEVGPVQLAPSQTYTTGILLGGLVSYSAIDKNGYFNSASDRFIQTALLYKQGHIRNIIIAAGHNSYIAKDYFSEAGFIKEKLTQLGIPAGKIYTDNQSRNTLENARYAKQILDTAHLEGPHLLISSAMHLRRASIAFQKAGLSITPYPCHFLAYGGVNNVLEDCVLPSSHALSHWDNLIKELLGLTVYHLKSSI